MKNCDEKPPGFAANPPIGTHLPALDGLRGVAILLVLLGHFDIYSSATALDATVREILKCGWMGVDLFFVLSGYLITGILWRTREDPAYFLKFYARRSLRIFPLYYAFVAAMLLIFAIFPHYRMEMAVSLANQAWIWIFLTNVLVTLKGHWIQAVPGFNHFWSLAVEEQFYLVWPALLWWIRDRRTMLRIVLSMLFVAPAFRVLCWADETSALGAFLLTPARMDAFAMGAVVFLLLQNEAAARTVARVAPRLAAVALTLLITLLTYAGSSPESRSVSTLGFSLTALFFGAVLAFTLTTRTGPFIGTLNHPFLRSVGKYSYALYVLHPAVRQVIIESIAPRVQVPLLFDSTMLQQVLVLALGFGLSYLLAVCSWYVLESPLLRFKDRFKYLPDSQRPAQRLPPALHRQSGSPGRSAAPTN